MEDHFLTGFGHDQAVKRCVAGPLMGAAQKVFFCFKHPLQKSHLSEFSGCFTKIPFEHSDKSTNMEYSQCGLWIYVCKWMKY